MISRRSPLATSNTTTSPWMVGRVLPTLAGVKVMSLVTASLPSVEGITNSEPWPASGITMRGGTSTPGSASRAAISSASSE